MGYQSTRSTEFLKINRRLRQLHPDITVAIRLDAANAQEPDHYLLPRLDMPDQEIRVSNKNSADFQCFALTS